MPNTLGVTSTFITRQLSRIVPALVVAVTCLLGAHGASAAVRVVVQPGDTAVAIGERYGVSATAIARANGLRNPALISVGRTLVVPAGGRVRSTPSARSRTTASARYTVRTGDSLQTIARRHGTSVQRLAAANGIADPDHVVAGTRLRVTSGGSTAAARRISSSPRSGRRYVVRSGDTLSAIAARHGTSVKALVRANGLRNADVVIVGKRLRIAAGGSSTSSAATASAGSGRRLVVRAGDTLSTIAARHGTTAAALARANRLRNPNTIVAGTRLRLPGATTATTSSNSRARMTPITAATAGWSGHASRAEVASLIAQSAARHGVDPALVRAIAWQESGWWQGARSNVGAQGVMQLMPTTADWVGPSLLGRRIDATNVRDNIDGGTAYLGWLMRNAPSRDVAVASYYQGLGSVTSRGMYDDTKSYVASVNGHYGRR